MKLSRANKSLPPSLPLSLIVLCISIITGFLAMRILQNNSGTAQASSANITVSQNNQIIAIDQSASLETITRTNTVTIKDDSAHWGYTLTAQLGSDPIPNSTVSLINPDSSTTCTTESPCILNTSTPTEIFSTIHNTATTSSGESITWTIHITIPANTPTGNYLLDIVYDMSAPTFDSMQDFSSTKCAALSSGTVLNLEDTRDHTVYRVKKMADSRCWMIDNLALDLNKTNTPNAPTFSPAAQEIYSLDNQLDTIAQYLTDLNGEGLDYPIPNYNNPKLFYYYNWCATMGDTSTNCATTRGYTLNQPTTTVTGICPAPFRLPRGTAGATGGNPATTTNDFAILDIAMDGTGASRGNANTYNNWLNDGVGGNYWSGQYHIANGNTFAWWSSTKNAAPPQQSAADFAIYPYHETYGANSLFLPTGTYTKRSLPVRCLL